MADANDIMALLMQGMQRSQAQQAQMQEARRRENLARHQATLGAVTGGAQALGDTFGTFAQQAGKDRRAEAERAEQARQFDATQSRLRSEYEGLPGRVAAELQSRQQLHATPSGDTTANIESREGMQNKELTQRASEFAAKMADAAKGRELTKQQIDNEMARWAADYGLDLQEFKHNADLELKKWGVTEEAMQQSMEIERYGHDRQVATDEQYDEQLAALGLNPGWIELKATEYDLDAQNAKINLLRAQREALRSGTSIDAEKWLQEQSINEENQLMKQEAHSVQMQQAQIMLDKVSKMAEAAQAAGFPSEEAIQVQSMLTGILGKEADIGASDARAARDRAAATGTTAKVKPSPLEGGPINRSNAFKAYFPELKVKDRKLRDIIMENPEVLKDEGALNEVMAGARESDKEEVRKYREAMLDYEEGMVEAIRNGYKGIDLEDYSKKLIRTVGTEHGYFSE